MKTLAYNISLCKTLFWWDMRCFHFLHKQTNAQHPNLSIRSTRPVYYTEWIFELSLRVRIIKVYTATCIAMQLSLRITGILWDYQRSTRQANNYAHYLWRDASSLRQESKQCDKRCQATNFYPKKFATWLRAGELSVVSGMLTHVRFRGWSWLAQNA